MNFLKSLSAASTKAATIAPPRVNSDPLKGGSIKIVNNHAALYGSETAGLIQKSYMMNGDLYAPVDYITQKSLRTKFYNYEVKKGEEKSIAEYMQLKGVGATVASLKEAAVIRKKALIDTNHAQIDKLLSRPNPNQSFKQWAEMAICYKLLSGERFIHVAGGLYPVSQLYVLPPTMMEVFAGDTYLSIQKYNYTPTQREFKPEEIHFSRTFHPAIEGYGEELRGLSPLRVMALLIQKSNEGMISSVSQMQQGGPPGILSLTSEHGEMTDEQTSEYSDALSRKHNSRNRGRVSVTGMKADWIKMGLSPVDLDLAESGLFDLRGICRVYRLDSKLFNDPSASTMNNLSEARKAAIVDAVIPAVEDLADDLNQIIEPYNVGGKRYLIDADVTHFPEMAEDLDKIMERMTKGPFSANQILEAMHYEANPNPLMDEPIMDAGRVPLSQWVDAPGSTAKDDGTY